MASEVKREKALREPPYSLDYEQALLAACMLEGGQDSLAKCVDLKLSPYSFYIPAHAEIFKICLLLYQEGAPVNELTVSERLKTSGKLERIGNYAYLNEITNRIETPANLSFYAQRVKDLEIARNLVRFFMTGLEDAYQGVDDIDHFIESVEGKVLEISSGRVEDSAQAFDVSLDKAVNTIQNLLQHSGSVSGVKSGFVELDSLTSGFHPAEMIVLAARPSMGKTALALNFAEAAILGKNPVPTLFFSLEMSAEQLAIRMLCGRARINMTKLRSGYIADGKSHELTMVASEFKKAPLWIDASSNATILELRSKARRVHAQHGLGLVIIDYLQLISGTDSKAPREQQIAEISRGIKGLAKELNVPVIVLSQLNRESEKERRQPRLSDLRESGSIEQDADLVLLLSKKFDENGPVDETTNDDVVVRELLIAKQRNGPVGAVNLTYVRSLTRFENYAKDLD